MLIKRGTVAEFEALGFKENLRDWNGGKGRAREIFARQESDLADHIADWTKDPTGGSYLSRLGAPTDPRYQSGWNFLSGKNLSPPSGKASTETSAPPPQAKPKNKTP